MFRTLYEHVACAAATKAQINIAVFFALIQRESGWNPQASGDGSYGIAQISPVSHPGVNVWNPIDSLFYSAQLLRNYLDVYAQKENPYHYALSAYNVGNTKVKNWDSIPKWEMDAYVNPILSSANTQYPNCTIEVTPTPDPEMIVQPQETPHPLLLLSFLVAVIIRKF